MNIQKNVSVKIVQGDNQVQINIELVGVIIGIITQGIYIAYRMGKFETKLDCIEAKQDKHNCLIERMVRVEDSTKSLHKRLDGIEENCHRAMRKWIND